MDEDRLAPNDLQAEYAVVVMCINDNALLPMFGERLGKRHFYNLRLGQIWGALNDCYKETGLADESRCSEFLPRSGEDNRGNADWAPGRFLYELGAGLQEPLTGQEDYWVRRVETAAFRRQMLTVSRELNERAYTEGEHDDEAVLLAESCRIQDDLVRTVSCGDIASESRLDIVVDDYLRYLDELAATPSMGPIPTDLIGVNQAFNGGFNRGEHYIIGARPGMGKTAFALWTVAWRAAMSGIPTVFFSLEMSKFKLSSRLLAALTGIPEARIARNKLDLAQQDLLKTAREAIAHVPLFIIDRPFDVKQVAGHARRMSAKMDVGLILLDYIQLLSRGIGDTAQETTNNVARLTLLAKETGAAVVSLSQLNRAVESRADKRPLLSDFAWSDRIGQDASGVLALYRDHYYNDEASPEKGEILVLKNRHGQENLCIEVGWNGPQTKYFNLDNAGKSTYL